MREAAQILNEKFDGSFINCVYDANQSAAALVNLLADEFPCFRDEGVFDGRTVRFYKRAQILVADLWACFDGESYGEFNDIDKITMFAGMHSLFNPQESSFRSNVPRLPNPTNAPSTRLPPILSALGKPHPASTAHQIRLKMGNGASRHFDLVRGVD